MQTGQRRGVSVRVFLADGTPEGLRVVEKSNWTGIATMCARAQYPEMRIRDEFSKPGVYVLIGQSESKTSQHSIYIGQADIARERLDDHLKNKDFWTHLILFSSKDTNLNKAHVQYIESKLIQLANQAKRAIVENTNVPRPPFLSEAERADADSFLDDMLIIYPLLGLSAFEVTSADSPRSSRRLFLGGPGAQASGQDTPEGFVVFKGSTARLDAVNSTHEYLLDQRADLLTKGVLIQVGESLELTQDYVFSSPSTAAGVFLGRSANGRTEWKDENGRTLKQIQEAALTNTLGDWT